MKTPTSTILTKFEDFLHNEGVSQARYDKAIHLYNMINRGFEQINSSLEKAQRPEIEKFISLLHNNQIHKKEGGDYSGTTKQDIKKFLKFFYKWSRGDGEYYPKEVAWIKTKIKKEERPEEKPILSIPQVRKLAEDFQLAQYRAITLMLYDSGFRIQEMLSVKKKDLTFEEYESGQKCWWISCNKSKTLIRKVDIPLFTEDINLFVESEFYQGKQPDDLLFDFEYDAYRMALKKRSRKILKVEITPHALRHSSATYYAREYEGDTILLATRYGWSYSADELKVYVRRSGAMQKRGARKVYANEVSKLKEENTALTVRVEKLEKFIEKMIHDKRKTATS